MEEINENPIIEKDLEIKIVETIKEEIIKDVVNDLDEIKLDDCNVQTPIILVGNTETKFIDFIGCREGKFPTYHKLTRHITKSTKYNQLQSTTYCC